jgi:hypothetical protein
MAANVVVVKRKSTLKVVTAKAVEQKKFMKRFSLLHLALFENYTKHLEKDIGPLRSASPSKTDKKILIV